MTSVVTSVWNQLITYLKNPKDEKAPDQTLRNKLTHLFSVLLADLIIMVILTGLIAGLEALGLFSAEDHLLSEIFENLTVWKIIAMGVLLVPFSEELIFRLFLRFQRNYFLRGIIWFAEKSGDPAGISIRIRKFWDNNYRIIFYLAALIFGYVHILNFQLSLALLLVSPVLVSPQIFMGIFLGYLRVNFGFFWGFFLHALHNFIFLIIPLFLLTGGGKVLEKKTEDYRIEIEESTIFSGSKSNATYHNDSIILKNVRFESIISGLTNTQEKFLDLKKEELKGKKINLRFYRYNDSIVTGKKVLELLKSSYDFETGTENREIDILRMEVVDPEILFSKTSTELSEGVNRVITTNSRLEFQKTDLKTVAKTLTSNFDQVVIYSGSRSKKVSFTLPNSNLDEIREILSEDYGLRLKDSTMAMEYLIIY